MHTKHSDFSVREICFINIKALLIFDKNTFIVLIITHPLINCFVHLFVVSVGLVFGLSSSVLLEIRVYQKTVYNIERSKMTKSTEGGQSCFLYYIFPDVPSAP